MEASLSGQPADARDHETWLNCVADGDVQYLQSIHGGDYQAER